MIVPKRYLFTAVAIVLGVVWAAFGIGWTILVLLCALLGYYVGAAFDGGLTVADLWEPVRRAPNPRPPVTPQAASARAPQPPSPPPMLSSVPPADRGYTPLTNQLTPPPRATISLHPVAIIRSDEDDEEENAPLVPPSPT